MTGGTTVEWWDYPVAVGGQLGAYTNVGWHFKWLVTFKPLRLTLFITVHFFLCWLTDSWSLFQWPLPFFSYSCWSKEKINNLLNVELPAQISNYIYKSILFIDFQAVLQGVRWWEISMKASLVPWQYSWIRCVCSQSLWLEQMYLAPKWTF
jgi:hypothetical protein